jgi:hypothetical protein
VASRGLPNATLALRRALAAVLASPTDDESARALNIVWWFFDCRASWNKVKEKDLIRDIVGQHSIYIHRQWPLTCGL